MVFVDFPYIKYQSSVPVLVFLFLIFGLIPFVNKHIIISLYLDSFCVSSYFDATPELKSSEISYRYIE